MLHFRVSKKCEGLPHQRIGSDILEEMRNTDLETKFDVCLKTRRSIALILYRIVRF